MLKNNNNISIISLDKKISRLLKNRFLWLGFKVRIHKSLKDFWLDFYNFKTDIIFIDDSIDKEFLFSLIKKLKLVSTLPIILLTKSDPDFYQTSFFDIDNIIIKPFSLRSLDLKILYILDNKPTYLSFIKFNLRSHLSFYLKTRSLKINKSPVSLTTTEFKIFSLLLSQKDQVCNKSLFLKSIWGYQDFWSFKSNLLEMHFSKLKKKLRIFFKRQKFLKKKKNDFLFRF